MSEAEIYSKLNEIFVDILDLESIDLKSETTAADVEGWDSLTHIRLIAEVEDVFDMKFPMKSVLTMKNVGEMVEIIKKAE